jgi:regulator of replication initiation timing
MMAAIQALVEENKALKIRNEVLESKVNFIIETMKGIKKEEIKLTKY